MTSKPPKNTIVLEPDEPCAICLSDFNKSTRKAITCMYCNAQICRDCVQKYLISDSATEANCPGCRAAWGQDFINANLTASFRTRNFKEHREKVLLDHERARLPETQPDAERYKYACDAVKPIQENLAKLHNDYDNHPAYKEFKEVQQKYSENEREYYKMHRRWMLRPEIHNAIHTRNGILAHNSYVLRLQRRNPQNLPIPELKDVPPLPETSPELKRHSVIRAGYTARLRILRKEIQPIEKEISDTMALITPYKYTIKQYGLVRDTDAAKIKHERQFIHKCPAPDCAGFLNTSWECGLCATKACKHCREPVTDPESHVCNPDTVETVKAIAKEAKPCPKCGTLISKISGCDQMWCTQCKTAFSWNTGRIETTVIHNPHYFQWMREAGKEIPRRDVPGDGCNIEHRLDTLFRKEVYNGHWAPGGGTDGRIKKTTLYKLSEIEQHRRHHHTVIRRLQANLREYEQDEWRRQLRVQRLVNEITEDEWKIKLQRKEKAYFKERAQLQLIDMYVNVCRDIIAQLLDDASEENQLRIMQQWNELCRFMEDERLKINKAYTCKSPNIFERYPFVIYYQKM